MVLAFVAAPTFIDAATVADPVAVAAAVAPPPPPPPSPPTSVVAAPDATGETSPVSLLSNRAPIFRPPTGEASTAAVLTGRLALG